VENNFLSRSYFTIKNKGNGIVTRILLNQDQRRSLIKTNFFYLNKWDLNNSYLDNQQLFEANSKSSEPLHKKSSWSSCF
jgi:hypothetical protein